MDEERFGRSESRAAHPFRGCDQGCTFEYSCANAPVENPGDNGCKTARKVRSLVVDNCGIYVGDKPGIRVIPVSTTVGKNFSTFEEEFSGPKTIRNGPNSGCEGNQLAQDRIHRHVAVLFDRRCGRDGSRGVPGLRPLPVHSRNKVEGSRVLFIAVREANCVYLERN